MNERVTGGFSRHVAEKPELCKHDGTCGEWRVVSCCKVAPDTDIEECYKCGKQIALPCSFDEEYS